MKYILLLLICLFSACSHAKNMETNEPKEIKLGVVLHFNVNNLPEIVPFSQKLNTTYSVYNDIGIDLSVKDIKLDSPVVVDDKKRKKLYRLFNHRDKNIHVFFVEDIKEKEGQEDDTIGLQCNNGIKKYIIVSEGSNNITLSHEIGHYFGLEHEKDKTNIMYIRDTAKRTKFTKKQIKKIRRGAIRKML